MFWRPALSYLQNATLVFLPVLSACTEQQELKTNPSSFKSKDIAKHTNTREEASTSPRLASCPALLFLETKTSLHTKIVQEVQGMRYL